MSLKMLSGFQKFDGEAFFRDKEFLLTKIEDWKEGTDQDHMRSVGTKVTGVIYSDNTSYGKDIKGVNQGESITFKVRKSVSSFENWQPFQTTFIADKFDKVSIWGDYRNHLSVKVPSLEVVSRGD